MATKATTLDTVTRGINWFSSQLIEGKESPEKMEIFKQELKDFLVKEVNNNGYVKISIDFSLSENLKDICHKNNISWKIFPWFTMLEVSKNKAFGTMSVPKVQPQLYEL